MPCQIGTQLLKPRNGLDDKLFYYLVTFAAEKIGNIHELAHPIESNHTPRFWNIVRTQTPTMEKASTWLKENGQILEEDGVAEGEDFELVGHDELPYS